METISVVIADQKKTNRTSYVKRLRPERGIHVVGEAGSTYEVVKALRLKPQVLLLDWKIAVLHGLSLLPLVRRQSPATRVILITERLTRAHMLDGLALGVRGYLRRAGARVLLPRAVRVVDQGEAWVPRTIVPPVVDAVSRLTLS
ncbi:response regulator [Candidatus Nitrospira bockiana]